MVWRHQLRTATQILAQARIGKKSPSKDLNKSALCFTAICDITLKQRITEHFEGVYRRGGAQVFMDPIFVCSLPLFLADKIIFIVIVPNSEMYMELIFQLTDDFKI